ncbi:hypothetical protein HDU97_007208 [Phlyctochytrium planicorne]|nr:hypothetical protein HDU97_007208 [Phlyctochytrium planicorne]
MRAGPSIVSFVALIAVQVTIGVVYRIAGASGKFHFNRASALAISEFVKLLLSYGLLVTTSENSKPRRRGSQMRMATMDYGKPGENDFDDKDFEHHPLASLTLLQKSSICNKIIWDGISNSSMPIFGLALLYAINNHLAFSISLALDPGTISLVKSASTFISAYILYTLFGRITNRLQWLAIALQAFGIITSQYDPCKGRTIYPLPSYALLFISVSITALAGCFNDYILKTMTLPLHAINVYLYASGFVLNLLTYSLFTIQDEDSPAFFEGFDSIGIFLVFLNCVIGLIVTAVYKYTDAVIKTIAQTISTGTLIVISAFWLGSQFGVLQFAGVMIIFLSVYLYFVCSSDPLKKTIMEYFGGYSSAEPKTSPENSKRRILSFGIFGVISFGLLNFTFWFQPAQVHKLPPQVPRINASDFGPHRYNTNITSFYKDILVVVNWNTPRYQHALLHWREIYPPILFPNVIHYGPANESLEAILAVMQDEFRVEERGNEYFPGYFGYFTLYRGLKEHLGKGYKGVLWVNFDVLINVARLTRLDKDNVWFTDRIGYMPMSAEGDPRKTKEISMGATSWYELGGFVNARFLYKYLPKPDLDAYIKKVSPMGEHVIPFTYYKPWAVPFKKETVGYGGDFIYIPFKHADRAIEFLYIANFSHIFLEFAVPFLADWVRMECGMSIWEHAYAADSRVEYEEVVKADGIGQTVDMYHNIFISEDFDKLKWERYVTGLYTL